MVQPTLEFALKDGGEFLEQLLKGRHLLLNVGQFALKLAGGCGYGWLGARRRGGYAVDRGGTLGIPTASGCCPGFIARQGNQAQRGSQGTGLWRRDPERFAHASFGSGVAGIHRHWAPSAEPPVCEKEL
jgi:hypothetical protein